MKLTSSNWQQYITRLSKINKKSSELMRQWIEKNGTSDTAAMIDYAYAIATKYGEAAAELACEMYDNVAEASGKRILAAEPAPTATYKETARAVNGARLQGVAVIPNAVERLVKLAGQDTTLNNAIRDGAQWAWIPSGDTCAFCITLASNGWQKASKKVRNGNHAEHIHANCDCAFSIRFDEAGGVDGYSPDNYLEQYRNAYGGKPQDKINAMRRADYAKRKDIINAQKREAYARRKQLKVESE